MKKCLWIIAAIFTVTFQLKANVIYSPGFTIQQIGNTRMPDVDCEIVIDNTCTTGSRGSASVLGVTISDHVSSSAFEKYWAPLNSAQVFARGTLAITEQDGNYWVQNFTPGAVIGADTQFVTSSGYLEDWESWPYSEWSDSAIWHESWNDIFGTSFESADGTHYGWIGFNWQPLTAHFDSSDIYALSVSITGDAYEACPNTPIAAGADSGGASCAGSDPAPEPASGILLAIGFILVMVGHRLFAVGKLARNYR